MKTIKSQTKLALALLDWHGGQNTGLYAVGSCMLSDCYKNRTYDPKNHRGHAPSEKDDNCGALRSAIISLQKLKERAKYPEAVTAQDEKECNALAKKLRAYLS